jgi:hypothetical protein
MSFDEPQDPFSPPLPAEPRPKRPSRLVIALLALSVGGVVVAAALLLPNVFPGLASTPGGPGKFDITGELKVTGSGLKYGVHSGDCQGDGGYSDLRGGTSVVITNASGATVAIGQLSKEGKPERHPVSPIKPVSCTFTFSVTGIPEGSEFYGVTIGKRGTEQYSRIQLGEPVRLALG